MQPHPVIKLSGKLKPNSITLSRSLAGRRSVRDQIPLHYSACDQLASMSVTSSRAASSWTKTCVCTSCVCRRPNSIPLSSSLAGRRPVRDQIPLRCSACDQLASRSAISSRAGRRPAHEQDSIMEYGLNRSATRFELSRHVQIARTCLRQVGNQVCNQVCDLDSVMEFSQSWSQTSFG